MPLLVDALTRPTDKHIERYLLLPLLLWRAITQPYWTCLELLVDLLLRIKLRQMDIIDR